MTLLSQALLSRYCFRWPNWVSLYYLTSVLFSASHTGSRLIFLVMGDGDSCSGVGGSNRLMISSKFLQIIQRIYNNYSMSPSWICSDKMTNERVARVGYNHFISNKGEWNNIVLVNSQTGFCGRFLQGGTFLNLAHHFPYDMYDMYDVKLRLLPQS